MSTTYFFSPEQEQKLIEAIQTAEKNTSGEIRIHVEPSCEEDPFAKALLVFQELEMHHTKEANGVLFYIAYESKKFAIVADEGINTKVADNFWEDIKDEMQKAFKSDQFVEGISVAVLKAGEQLQQYFPYQEGKDKNELSDDISKG
ncbi:MAG: TPM domain-containing protein [Saprospiraceae bacterium]|nr:TPM domain-containing protein [Saprospiraceae bacterium]